MELVGLIWLTKGGLRLTDRKTKSSGRAHRVTVGPWDRGTALISFPVISKNLSVIHSILYLGLNRCSDSVKGLLDAVFEKSSTKYAYQSRILDLVCQVSE